MGSSLKGRLRKWQVSTMKQHDHENNKTLDPAQSLRERFTGKFALDLELVRNEIGHNSDVRIREFYIGGTGICAAIIFVDGLSDKELIDKHIMNSLMASFFEKMIRIHPLCKESSQKSLLKIKFLPLVK